jgi:hypothetical protein
MRRPNKKAAPPIGAAFLYLMLLRRQRRERVGDVDHIARQVEQVSPLAGVIFALGLLRELNRAGAIGEGAAGVVIDKAGHGDVSKHRARAQEAAGAFCAQLRPVLCGLLNPS